MENQRHSIRIYHRNYSQPGYYFVTVDTYKHEFILGDIKNNIFIPNKNGQILNRWINFLPSRYPKIRVYCYQIMPNHFHLIILIKGNFNVKVDHNSSAVNKRQLLPQVIGFLKMNTSKEIRNAGSLTTEKLWLRNYYQRIIRSKKELLKYKQYITNNPKNWYFSK